MLKELNSKEVEAVSGGCCLSLFIPRCWVPKRPGGGGGYKPPTNGGGYTPTPPNNGYGVYRR